MNPLEDFGGAEIKQKTFFTHVFDMSQEANGEIMNVTQYAILGIIPVIILNKLIQRFAPEADPDNSSVELLIEVLLQTIVMFVGIIFIHRIITYIPTYSGFRYEHLTLTNVVLAFLIIVLSLQTKLGIKVNILYDRLLDLWDGRSSNQEDKKSYVRSRVRVNDTVMNSHNPSQADFLDTGSSSGMFPPAPVVQSKPNSSYDYMMRGAPQMATGPAPANSVVGGGFGAFF